MPPTRVHHTPQHDNADDAGFTMIEALVSFVILLIVATASVYAVVQATTTSKRSTDRVTAANLAQRDLQAARSLRYPTYPTSITNRAIAVGTTTYTLTRVVGSSAKGACPAAPNFTTNPYMIVTTTVTWKPSGPKDRVVAATEMAC